MRVCMELTVRMTAGRAADQHETFAMQATQTFYALPVLLA